MYLMPSCSSSDLSLARLVTQAVFEGGWPLTLNEIKARVEMVRPVNTRNPRSGPELGGERGATGRVDQ
jgi:hypothetical protein